MKFILSSLFTLMLTLSYSQLVGGAVIAEKRDVLPEASFELEGPTHGWATFELAVDRNGNVTSAHLKDGTLKSSIDKNDAKKHAMKIKFTAGTHFPKFHTAEVKITMVKWEKPPKELEISID